MLRQVACRTGSSETQALATASAEIHVLSFALAFGLMSGFSLLLATVWLVIRHRAGEPLGPRLALLGQYLPGYQVSWLGGLIGFAYLLRLGAAFLAAVGWTYNRLIAGRASSASKANGPAR